MGVGRSGGPQRYVHGTFQALDETMRDTQTNSVKIKAARVINQFLDKYQFLDILRRTSYFFSVDCWTRLEVDVFPSPAVKLNFQIIGMHQT